MRLAQFDRRNLPLAHASPSPPLEEKSDQTLAVFPSRTFASFVVNSLHPWHGPVFVSPLRLNDDGFPWQAFRAVEVQLTLAPAAAPRFPGLLACVESAGSSLLPA